MNNITKGLAIISGVLACGATLSAAPIVTVSAPLWGIMGATYKVNALAASGVAAATAAGAGIGKVAGETGGALVIQGMSDASQRLMERVRSE